jgi:hypothetical protein
MVSPDAHAFSVDVVGVGRDDLERALLGDSVLNDEHARDAALLQQGELGGQRHAFVLADENLAPCKQPRLEGEVAGVGEADANAQVACLVGDSRVYRFDSGVEGAVGEGVHAHCDGHADAHLAQQHFGQRALEVEAVKRHDARYGRACARHDADIHEPLGDHTIKGRADDRVRELLAQQREVRLRLLQRGACGFHTAH